MTLDEKSQAAVKRWVDALGPLSERQKDLIAAVFHGTVPEPKGKR
jgi:hypothetical protein